MSESPSAGPIRIVIPPAAVVVLVGPAGAGKSTFAARHFPAGATLSSDSFRARVGRGEHDQAATARAFRALHADLAERLTERAGRRGTVVIDATNLGPAARRPLLGRAASAGIPCVAIVFDLPIDVCLTGVRARGHRPVPDDVVARQWRRLQADLGVLEVEGFAAIHILRSRTELDAVRVAIPGRAVNRRR